jgi:hypothetical protein
MNSNNNTMHRTIFIDEHFKNINVNNKCIQIETDDDEMYVSSLMYYADDEERETCKREIGRGRQILAVGICNYYILYNSIDTPLNYGLIYDEATITINDNTIELSNYLFTIKYLSYYEGNGFLYNLEDNYNHLYKNYLFIYLNYILPYRRQIFTSNYTINIFLDKENIMNELFKIYKINDSIKYTIGLNTFNSIIDDNIILKINQIKSSSINKSINLKALPLDLEISSTIYNLINAIVTGFEYILINYYLNLIEYSKEKKLSYSLYYKNYFYKLIKDIDTTSREIVRDQIKIIIHNYIKPYSKYGIYAADALVSYLLLKKIFGEEQFSIPIETQLYELKILLRGTSVHSYLLTGGNKTKTKKGGAIAKTSNVKLTLKGTRNATKTSTQPKIDENLKKIADKIKEFELIQEFIDYIDILEKKQASYKEEDKLFADKKIIFNKTKTPTKT